MENRTQKLLISDLDGTLLFAEGEERVFHEKDIHAIRQFQQQGNLVAVNSGRTVAWLTQPLEGHIEWDYLIASSGAVIVKRLTDADMNMDDIGIKDIGIKDTDRTDKYEIIDAHPFPRQSILGLLEKLQSESMQYEITFQTLKKVYSMNQKTGYGLPITAVQDIDEITANIYGVSMHFAGETEANAYASWFRQSGIADIACYQNKQDIDMVAAGCSKGTAIQTLCAYLHIPIEHCYAIGDSYNDIEMLKAVDNAYTFHHSPEEVRSCSKKIVDSVEEMLYHLR